MTEFERKLRNLIERMTRENKPAGQVEAAVKRMLLQNPAERVFPDIRNLSVDDFVKQFGVSEVQQDAINSRLAPILKMAEKASKNFKEDVLNAVQLGYKEAAKNGIEGDYRAVAREILRKADSKLHHIETQIVTASAALDRASNVESERAAGVEWFRYVGPTGNARAFCAQHAGRVYHISEILAMDNGQGLSVLYNMGGWHCRHQWVGVSVEIARLERSDWFAKAA